ncbi:MAG TPA: VOC family protein [Gemmatimonadaceae bacterium]
MTEAKDNSRGAAPTLKQLTPVLIVDAVEPCVKFWTDRLGFEITNKVPDSDGKLIFASVQKGPVEIMYQTRASVLSEDPGAASDITGHSVALFITVDDLNSIEKSLAGAPVVKPRHDTFYGSTEIYVREPGGNTVGFAQFS